MTNSLAARGVIFSILMVTLVLGILSTAPVHKANAISPGPNGKIAFIGSVNDAPQIFTIYPNGTGLSRLTFDPASDFDPHWSPDGAKIVFDSSRDGHNFRVFTMNADGSSQRELTNNTSTNEAAGWSPNGTKILFNRYPALYSMNQDGSLQTQLTNDSIYVGGGQYSPDGTKILLYDFTNNFPAIMNVKTKVVNDMTNVADFEGCLAWSPDGKKIAYCASAPAFRGIDDDIFVMNADGTNPTDISDTWNETNNLINSGVAIDEGPSWSPDGTKIAFESNRGANYFIYTTNTDGSGVSLLTGSSMEATEANWGPQPTSHSLSLFVGAQKLGSNSTISLGENLTARATTNDTSIGTVTFTWIGPDGNVHDSETVPINHHTAKDIFSPNLAGRWTVNAEFGNGIVLSRHFHMSMFVLPESPIGVIAVMLGSLAAFGGFIVYRKHKS